MTEIKIQKLAGVIGWPVCHSMSSHLHSFWLEKYGIDGAYIKLAVSPENLESALRSLPKLGFSGTNITTPHKENALHIVDYLDPVAKRIGAINTIFVNKDSSLYGTNTDGLGFIENLRSEAPEWEASKLPVVVLGAGGASKSVVVSLIDAGVPEVRLVNRTLSRAKALSSSINGPITLFDWDQASDCLRGASMVVNTTVLGMSGQPPMKIDLSFLSANALVADIVYTPLITPLLEQAKNRGLKTVDGLGMLLYQAVLGFEGWFGHKPDVTESLRDHILVKLAIRNG